MTAAVMRGIPAGDIVPEAAEHRKVRSAGVMSEKHVVRITKARLTTELSLIHLMTVGSRWNLSAELDR